MKEFVPDPAKGPVHAFREAVKLAREAHSSVILSGPDWDQLPTSLRAIDGNSSDADFARCMVTAFLADIAPTLIVDGFQLSLPDKELKEVFDAMERNSGSEQVMIAALQVLGSCP